MSEGCNLYCTESDIEQIESSINKQELQTVEEYLSENESDRLNYEEIERRISEANQVEPDGRTRTDFGRDVGQGVHKYEQDLQRQQDLKNGRIEVPEGGNHNDGDFAIEYSIKHPDGSSYRFDYVDFKNDVIWDWKPQDGSTSDVKLAKGWEEKMNKYAEAYTAETGRVPEVYLRPYPSTKDIFNREDK